VSPYLDPERQRQATREWAAARRLEWSAGKVCADCGSTPVQAWHPTVPTKSVWTRRASYREPILAEAVALCRRCATARRLGRTTLEWCPATERWCDGPRRTSAVLRAAERLLAA
jgi:hypothetical protein